MEKKEEKRDSYQKPQMTVMRINRFFFARCQNVWPNCYTFYLFIPGAARCR